MHEGTQRAPRTNGKYAEEPSMRAKKGVERLAGEVGRRSVEQSANKIRKGGKEIDK